MHVTALPLNVQERLYENNREDIVDPRKEFSVSNEVQFTDWDESEIGPT